MSRGPSPWYRPKLTAEQIELARQVASRRHASHAKVQRAQMAVLIYDEPSLSNQEIARRVGVHPDTVLNQLRRWNQEGFDLEDRPRSGRPKVFSPAANRSGQGMRV